ncbi:MAG: tRNA uridine-5-carboxymethylaminomethyl(34) synthesis GTPase MnmE [Deltaproteobacteria bacterium]|uniref:tRNA modification GTPase MnmE n=1 Tax=Candidatus Zymogenus saltonus TaxID=2844893 RepID=A0A9D8KG45_9DELT|nr:tRNA uridine-5-carboxymethylaminomethyl(34) synthesis GTPase MnmE [Candidatus Zymogenus saltonus]
MNRDFDRKIDADTIVAVATPWGEGAIGVVRLSGPDSLSIGKKLFRFIQKPQKIETHRMYLGDVLDSNGKAIDRALFVFMESPSSYTGEDVVELQCHGGPLLLESVVLGAVSAGARPAENGEFTRRAFMNGKLDLAQAEAVLDIITSVTERGLLVSAGQLFGGLSGEIEDMKEALVLLLADVEASIDFPDEETEIISREVVIKESERILKRIEELLSTYRRGRMLKEGASVVILGCPNVGKSSLMNRLLGADRAIVTAEPGTTRDTVWDFTRINGIPLKIVDTCGIREVLGEAEREGVRRAWEAVSGADIILLVIDVTSEIGNEEERMIYLIEGGGAVKEGVATLVVLNKVDLLDVNEPEGKEDMRINEMEDLPFPYLFTSALTGRGIDDLRSEIRRLLLDEAGGGGAASDRIIINNARHLEALLGARRSLTEILNGENIYGPGEGRIKRRFEPELLAVDIRGALTSLKEITGEVGAEDVLDAIFSRFCVGK